MLGIGKERGDSLQIKIPVSLKYLKIALLLIDRTYGEKGIPWKRINKKKLIKKCIAIYNN